MYRFHLIFSLIFCLMLSSRFAEAQDSRNESEFSISGTFYDSKTKEPLPFAVITTADNKNWASADKDAYFQLNHLPKGDYSFNIYLFGYVSKTLNLKIGKNLQNISILLDPISLELDEVKITAESRTKKTNSSSSYSIDRTALDHLQATNITDVMSLLPGGKFRGDLNLTNSNATFEVRGGKGEMNSTSFSTAVEVDGVRLSNNANFGKIQGVDNRSIAVTNVEAVEIVTGIPSVEYGDLNSGMVRISTAKGRSPLVLEFVTRPNTKLYSARKGFILGNGTLNASIERAKSISSLISPYTSYNRNGVTLSYNQRLNPKSEKPLLLSAGLSGNIGGYDSKLDPDLLGDSYTKVTDNGIRANLGLDWAVKSKILSRLEWKTSFTWSDKQTTDNSLESSPSSQVAIHAKEDGYYVAQDYDKNPDAEVVLVKPGHWYQLGYYDDKPLYFTTKLKADSKNWYGKKVFNHIMLGAEYSYAHNLGRGEFYDDMRYAPTWREYRLDQKPAMNNLSVFLEDNLDIQTTADSHLMMTAGLRSDLTMISGSNYGMVSALSPRFNLRYVVWENKNQIFSDLEFHAGWGKAVKLPSFNILYPEPNYMDLATFSSTSDASNIAFAAYRTIVNEPLFNKELRWQSNQQLEIGTKAKIAGMEISLLFYHNVVLDTYTSQTNYKPFSYNYTGPSALEKLQIPSANRIYTVDKDTGIITVKDHSGRLPAQQLDYITYNRFIYDSRYVNGSPVHRTGIEYYINFPKMKFLNSQIRIDGNFYRYKGIDEVMSQSYPGMYTSMSDGKPYKYIGHYVGPASAANGDITKEANMNIMLTTHIPEIRLILSLRLESTLMSYGQNLSESSKGNRSFVLENDTDYIGTDPDIYNRNKFIVTYPLYYTTWEEPDVKIPFMEKFLWAKDNDKNLFNDLARLVEKSNYPFIFNQRTVSPYYSINLNITKELGDYASVSFYSTNFLNNMQKIYSTWDNIEESSIYGSGYIPTFYYGLSIRMKF